MGKLKMPRHYTYARYLEAKRSVDDRALNRPVFETLQARLKAHSQPGRIRVLEIGGGTASMVRRLLNWSVLSRAHYTLVDAEEQSLASVPNVLRRFCDDRISPTRIQGDGDVLHISSDSEDIELSLVNADIGEYLQGASRQFDLILAHAVLDLVDLGQVLPLLWKSCNDRALFWFTINFDGESTFLPPLDGDSEILAEYHASMNRRPGSRYSGRALFTALRQCGAGIVSAGSSDWVVHAAEGDNQENAYPDDESYFLHHILHTIDQELTGHPTLDERCLQRWIDTRHQQVDSGKLVYIAHQLDFVGTPPKQIELD